MKIAIIGARNLNLDISKYIPKEATEIISGGAKVLMHLQKHTQMNRIYRNEL